MKIVFSGGAYEIGASCIMLKLDGKNILLDSGIRQNGTKDILPDFRIIQELGGVDAIVVSHAHLDHIGSLPIISSEYPNARIYMNYMTKDLVRVLLYDSLKIMNNREGEIPKFAEIHVQNMLDRVFVISLETEFEILKDIKITLYTAGHIGGASCVYIKSNEGSIFYSGDFSLFSQNTVEGARIPKLRPDVAIFESTYGDKLHSNREIEEDRLVKLISRCTENGGKVLIPAFALGRAQEVILILKKALNKGKLKGVKIYVDGMVKDINTVYKLHPTYLKNSLSKKILKGMDPFYGENIIPVTKQEEREGILESKDPCIIVSSSGMLTGGPSQYYAEKLCMIEKNLIVLTGYQDEESPGRKLLDLLDEDKSDRILEIDGRKIPVNCSIQKVGLSAHGDKNEIKALIQAMMPRNIFLVHGDGSIIENLSKELSREVKVPIYVPESGETIDIDIKNPRKQFEKNIKFKMYRKDEINEKNITELWEFVLNNYGSKFFTGEDLLLIWRGDTSGDVDSLRKILINSIYFEPDRKRLFLYKAKEKNLVEEELKPKELKQNEVNEIVKDFFEEYGYQKAGLMVSEKKVILYFDFPEAVDNSIYDKIEEFKNVTSWDVTVYGQSNINAAEQLIRQLLPEAPIKKISYYAHEKKFLVTVEENIEIKDEPQRFKEATGLELEVSGTNSKKRTAGFTIKTDSNNKMEQNMALKYIEDYFKDMEHKPYKKSIKSGQDGHYIELAFISPTIGNRYIDVIKKVSNIIGWDISISSSTNQNEVINIASALCKSSGVDIYKNPSFNPADLSVTVKVTKGEVEKLDEIKDSFERLTGCTLLLKKV